MHVKKNTIIGFLLLLGLCAACRVPFVPLTRQDIEATLTHGGLERNYILHLPDGHTATEKKALLVVLHGGGGSSRGMIKLTEGRFNMLADEKGFLVVYPEAIDKQWNDERGDKTSRVHRRRIDDVGFLLTLIRKLKDEYPIDPQRVFVAGISNGGMMALRLAIFKRALHRQNQSRHRRL